MGEDWAVTDPNQDSLRTGQRVELCDKTVLINNGGCKQEEFTQKKVLSLCLRKSHSAAEPAKRKEEGCDLSKSGCLTD